MKNESASISDGRFPSMFYNGFNVNHVRGKIASVSRLVFLSICMAKCAISFRRSNRLLILCISGRHAASIGLSCPKGRSNADMKAIDTSAESIIATLEFIFITAWNETLEVV